MNLDYTLLGIENSDDGSSVTTHAANISAGAIIRSIVATKGGQIGATSCYVPGVTVRPGATGQPGYLKSLVR